MYLLKMVDNVKTQSAVMNVLVFVVTTCKKIRTVPVCVTVLNYWLPIHFRKKQWFLLVAVAKDCLAEERGNLKSSEVSLSEI